MAGPPDLDHAIQAAAGALQLTYDWEDYDVNDVASVVLRAALFQATDGAVQWYSDTLRTLDGERMAAEAELETTRDRVADLEVHAAEAQRLRRIFERLVPVIRRSLNGAGPRSNEYALAVTVASYIDEALAALDLPAAQEEGGG